MKLVRESISNKELLYSIFSDQPLNFIESKNSSSVNRFTEEESKETTETNPEDPEKVEEVSEDNPEESTEKEDKEKDEDSSDNDETLRGESKSSNTEPTVKEEPQDDDAIKDPSNLTTTITTPEGLNDKVLKSMRKSFVDYLNQNANTIFTDNNGQTIKTNLIYDEGNDSNIKVKNDHQGSFTITIAKGASEETLGSKVSNATAGAIRTLAGVQPFTLGQG